MDINSLKSLTAENGKKDIGEATQYIVVDLGNEQYGIDIRYIDNIVRMQKITRVPQMPPYLIGIINLRGEVLPVVSLRLKMGLEAEEYTKATRIIIIKSETEGTMGLIVDEVKEVVTLYESQMEKIESELKNEGINYVNYVGKQENGSLISLLDLTSITLEENVAQ